MQFMGCLYTGDSVSSEQYKIIEKVHKGKVVSGLYLITLSNHPDNMLDLMLEEPAIGFEAANHYYFSRGQLAEKILNCRYLIAKLDGNG